MSEIKIGWAQIGNKPFIKFTFGTYLDKLNAQKAIFKWESMISSLNEKVELIWDCKNMKDYDPVARRLFQKTLTFSKYKIAKIWVLTDLRIIKTATVLTAKSTLIDFEVVDTEEKITSTSW